MDVAKPAADSLSGRHRHNMSYAYVFHLSVLLLKDCDRWKKAEGNARLFGFVLQTFPHVANVLKSLLQTVKSISYSYHPALHFTIFLYPIKAIDGFCKQFPAHQ